MERSNPFILLALCGQAETHRIQEMQAFLFTIDGLSLFIAPTGHPATQIPHWVHAFAVLGTAPAFAVFLHGMLPGTFGVLKSRLLSFPLILSANSFNCS